MQRNWQLIRVIVKALEERTDSEEVVWPNGLESYSSEQVSYQIYLLKMAGLVDAVCRDNSEGPFYCIASNLTWEGHELAGKIASDEQWEKLNALLQEKKLPSTFEAINLATTVLIKRALDV